MPAASHPIWKTINTAVVMLCATFFLWINASKFDATEWKSIVGIVGTMLGWNVVQAKLESK